MINELTIKGLKCFEEAEFHFKNLTLLAGKNSMGKSTVIQALLAMIQKGKNPFRGEYIDNTSYFWLSFCISNTQSVYFSDLNDNSENPFSAASANAVAVTLSCCQIFKRHFIRKFSFTYHIILIICHMSDNFLVYRNLDFFTAYIFIF